jgi:RimJ/RimL family protein N-acetyltransferase
MAATTLRDGTEVEIRPIGPADKDRLAEAFARLSPESRYRRFFRPLKELRAGDLRYLTEIDHHDHEALVAIAADGSLVGVARYVRTEEEPELAEVAVTIVDDWHGRGVATELLRALVDRARAEGIERFVALVLGENREALDLFKSLARNDARPRRREGYLELLIDLPEGRVSGSGLGRALRGAAAGTIEFNPLRLLKRALAEPPAQNRPRR